MAVPHSHPPTDLITAGELAIQESTGKEEGLVQSKDKAQLAATTAMSIVNIALLKNLLDTGPDGNKYYTVVLMLVSVSLALQCLVGLLSLCVTNLQTYYRKYKDDPLRDLFEHMCHCRCVCTDEEEFLHDIIHDGVEAGKAGTVHSYRRNRCCPWKCTTKVREDYEYRAMHMYNQSIDELVEVELKYVASNEELEELVHKEQELRSRHIELREKLTTANDDKDEIAKDIKEIEEEIEDIDKKKKIFESQLQAFNVKREKTRLLSKYVMAIKKNWVLKKVTFWQNAINYMLYLVFIMNAFVTGLGLAGATGATGGSIDGATSGHTTNSSV